MEYLKLVHTQTRENVIKGYFLNTFYMREYLKFHPDVARVFQTEMQSHRVSQDMINDTFRSHVLRTRLLAAKAGAVIGLMTGELYDYSFALYDNYVVDVKLKLFDEPHVIGNVRHKTNIMSLQLGTLDIRAYRPTTLFDKVKKFVGLSHIPEFEYVVSLQYLADELENTYQTSTLISNLIQYVKSDCAQSGEVYS